MRRRTLLRIAKKLPPRWRPIGPGLPRAPHPLPIQLAHVAQWFHAMSDTTRLHILEFLSQQDRFLTELRDLTDAPQSSIAFHLKVLRESGLVRAYRNGRRKYYGLHGETLEHMIAFTRKMGPGAHVGTCLLDCCRGLLTHQ